MSIRKRRMENPLMQRLLLKLHTLSFTKSIVFCWIPSHIGIRGNEDADISAKQAQSLQESKIKLPFTDFKPNLNTYILSKGNQHGIMLLLTNSEI